jgi:3-deoxy-D-manno-octulosonic-acid transferase
MVQELQKEGQNVALRSQHEKLEAGTNIYVVDTLGISFTNFFTIIFLSYNDAK